MDLYTCGQGLPAVSHGFLAVLITLNGTCELCDLGQTTQSLWASSGAEADHKAGFVLALSVIVLWVGMRVKTDRRILFGGILWHFSPLFHYSAACGKVASEFLY